MKPKIPRGILEIIVVSCNFYLNADCGLESAISRAAPAPVRVVPGKTWLRSCVPPHRLGGLGRSLREGGFGGSHRNGYDSCDSFNEFQDWLEKNSMECQ